MFGQKNILRCIFENFLSFLKTVLSNKKLLFRYSVQTGIIEWFPLSKMKLISLRNYLKYTIIPWVNLITDHQIDILDKTFHKEGCPDLVETGVSLFQTNQKILFKERQILTSNPASFIGLNVSNSRWYKCHISLRFRMPKYLVRSKLPNRNFSHQENPYSTQRTLGLGWSEFKIWGWWDLKELVSILAWVCRRHLGVISRQDFFISLR